MHSLPRFPARAVHNRAARRDRPYSDAERRILSLAAFAAARAEVGSWPGYAPTPLVSLPGLAARLGLAAVHYKDEAHRFGLMSFKALGGAYAVLTILQRDAARRGLGSPAAADFVADAASGATLGVTVAAATDGNHGRSVAWGAEMFGCACVIYLHANVSVDREREIARYGARIVRVPGNYDDSVRQCAQDALANGWTLVADTSDDADDPVPAMVMQGYTILAEEIFAAMPAGAPSHVLVPAGVGGLAAALAGHSWERFGPLRPRLVVVEPTGADCVFRTVEAGRPVRVEGDIDTFMACLAAGEVSAPAWAILEHAADDVLALDDAAAMETMRLLAGGIDGDPPIVAGESGAAATAGLIAAMGSADLAARLGLDAGSVVVVIGSEGATDAATYARTVGRSAAEVAAGRRGVPEPAQTRGLR